VNELEDVGGAVVSTAVFAGLTIATGGTFSVFGLGTLGSFAALTAINYGLNELGEALAPSAPDFGLERQRSDITTVSPIGSHKIIYGRALTGGNLVYSQLASNDSDYLNMVIALAPHNIEGIQKLFINSDVGVDLEVDDEVMSVDVQEHYSNNQTATVTKTGTLAVGGQITVDAYHAGAGTLTLVSGGTTIFSHTGGGVVRFETHQNTTNAPEAYTLTFTPSGSGNRVYVQLLNCNFQVAEKYKDLIHFYPSYGEAYDYFEFLGRDVSDDTTSGNQYSSTDGEWDQRHGMSGVSHIWARIKYDPDVWQGRPPNISCVVKGKKLYDPRTETFSWSDNPALCIRDYLTNTLYGCGVQASSEIDEDSFISAANLCDEVIDFDGLTGPAQVWRNGEALEADDGSGYMMFVPNSDTAADYYIAPFHVGDTVNIGGVNASHPLFNQNVKVLKFAPDGKKFYFDYTYTSGAETSGDNIYLRYSLNRYSCNGLLETAKSKKNNLDQLLTSCAGNISYTNGFFRLLGGEYRSPEFTITQEDIVGPVSISTRPPARALFNTMKGFYSDRNTNYVFRDYRPYENATYITADGGVKNVIDLPLKFTTNPKQAEELTRIAMDRTRMFERVTITCNMSAFRYQVGDTVQLTYPRASITNKVYEIIDYKINVSETVTIDLVLQELSSTLYPI